MTSLRLTISQCIVFTLLLLMAPLSYAEKPFTVAILMFDDVQIIDFAAPYEVFGQAGYEVFTVSENGKTVNTVMGLSVNPDHSFKTMPEADAILVPGGDVHEVMKNESVQQWLTAMQRKSEHILSVCTGSHILAESGLLDNQSATTFHRAIDNFEETYPDITVLRQKRFVDNGQVVTSAGLSSGIDASLHLVSKVSGEEKARTVAMHIEYDWDLEGGFVRAEMADKHFPDNDYDWPEGILFDRQYSYGSQTDWKLAVTAQTTASAEELTARYKQAMLAHDSWVLIPASQQQGVSWRGTGELSAWRHDVHISLTEQADTYLIALEMHKIADN
ncbi:DJ-1/PfpI family protein [Lacimicrobium sp. SS2-24]|uniref:DJ-1/PfpI family protein n=1 Tax=Lacimicrobium sp. SS2-24 TaxID=2005569 RepID=UPI000B4AF81E|nr:DJ-1/PfpI family protein [Lacimicrobium sp. SS2-24]